MVNIGICIAIESRKMEVVYDVKVIFIRHYWIVLLINNLDPQWETLFVEHFGIEGNNAYSFMVSCH